jgi:hypothetical protein
MVGVFTPLVIILGGLITSLALSSFGLLHLVQFRSMKIHAEVVSNNCLALHQVLSGGDNIANGWLILVLGRYLCKSVSIYAVYPHRK